MIDDELIKRIKKRKGTVTVKEDIGHISSHADNGTAYLKSITESYEKEFPFEKGWVKVFSYKRTPGQEFATITITPISLKKVKEIGK